MIRAIVAIDEKRGMADDHGIPWQGKTPTDNKYYHDSISKGTLIMGYGMYKEVSKPYPGGTNYVATNSDEQLRDGFQAVKDAHAFLETVQGDAWNLGGPGLIASTMDLIDELYITQLEGDFGCTKFLPEYQQAYEKISESDAVTENGITYRFTVWRRKK